MADEITLALPFTLTAQGTVESTSDQKKIWADRVFSVIATSVSERVNRYGFGTKITTEAFNGREQAAAIIKSEVSDAFVNFLPYLTLIEVKTDFAADLSTVNVEVDYALPNTQKQTTPITSISLNGNQPFQEQ